MSKRCPHCSSVIEALEDAPSSIICPSCGLEVGSTHSVGISDETHASLQESAAATIEFDRKTDDTPRGPSGLPLQLGRYKLQDELGAGAFGRVFRAYDTELQRTVAIKILKAERFASQAELDRFFDEARLMASVHHPGIVAVHDVGVDQGLNYIVTQYISGGTLHDRLARDSISRTEAANLVCQCASAIHAAHKLQLYHRDLKPKNILLDPQGRAYVGDFGLAIRRRDEGDRIGEFAGSVNFMSPEQLRGDIHFIDGRTDVWALGIIFYLMLTDQLPFQGSTRRLITDIQGRIPLPPRQLDETIPHELERICLKCIEKSLADRYSTAFDLAEDLNQWLLTDAANAGSPAPSRPRLLDSGGSGPQPPTVLMPRPPATQSRKRLTVIVALALLVGLGWIGRNVVSMFSPSNSLQASRMSPTTALDPFRLDSNFVSGRPYPLLESPPREVIWPTSDFATTARWYFDEKREELSVDAPEFGLLGLGQTHAESFRIRVAMNRNSWHEFAGIFWGFQEIANDGGTKQPHCHALLIQGYNDPQGQRKLLLGLNHLSFTAAAPEDPLPLFQRRELKSLKVTIEHGGPYDLTLTVHAGRLTSIRWCGEEFPELLDHTIDPSLPLLSHRGTFGVMVIGSSAVFSDARVTVFDQALPNQPSSEKSK